MLDAEPNTAKRLLVLRSLIYWNNPPATAMREHIVSQAKAGDIVLMHPAAPTEQALAAMIQGVRAKGLTLVTLNTLPAQRHPGSNQGCGRVTGARTKPLAGGVASQDTPYEGHPSGPRRAGASPVCCPLVSAARLSSQGLLRRMSVSQLERLASIPAVWRPRPVPNSIACPGTMSTSACIAWPQIRKKGRVPDDA